MHLTTFRQQFYDQTLDERIGYARHAISIDERRGDFKRVKWGEGKRIERPAMERLVQTWFAGNHADIGGGYPRAAAAGVRKAPRHEIAGSGASAVLRAFMEI